MVAIGVVSYPVAEQPNLDFSWTVLHSAAVLGAWRGCRARQEVSNLMRTQQAKTNCLMKAFQETSRGKGTLAAPYKPPIWEDHGVFYQDLAQQWFRPLFA